jgi:hypothetical protein
MMTQTYFLIEHFVILILFGKCFVDRLQKERVRRIERYKQRLALLLPLPSDLGRHDPL